MALLLALLAFALPLSGWTWRADRLVYDIGLSFWRRPVPEGLVVVAIDDASVAAIGRWPWPRAVHSTLLARLAEAQPRAIGLDVTFSEPDPDPAQDALLARQLALAAPVVMSVDWVLGGPGQPPRLLTPVTGLPPGVSVGTAEASVDADGVMRHAFLSAGAASSPVPHMALALLRAGARPRRPACRWWTRTPLTRWPPGRGSAAVGSSCATPARPGNWSGCPTSMCCAAPCRRNGWRAAMCWWA